MSPSSYLACAAALAALSLNAVPAVGEVDGPTPDKGANGEQTRPRSPPYPAREPLETGKKNAPEFSPAFPEQTRAPGLETRTVLEVRELVRGLALPWGLAFLPDGRMLVTEKHAGRLRIVRDDGAVSAPIAGVPRVDGREQGGLMDVALAPDFARSRYVFLSYYEPRKGGNGLNVLRARLSEDEKSLAQKRVVFRMQPTLDSARHAGGRLVWAQDGTLFITLGERYESEGRRQARDLRSDFGKIVRVRADGSIPDDNPFVGQKGVRPEIWSRGHRNVLGGALDERGRLWVAEMGPRGGDELNLIVRGNDYGWPTIGYGEEYSGAKIHDRTQAPGLTQPVYYWDPVISPSSLAIYSGKLIPEWKGHFFIGGLSSEALIRLVLRDDKVVGEERLLLDRKQRIRNVVEGPDGALYLLTDEADGKVLRLAPKRP